MGTQGRYGQPDRKRNKQKGQSNEFFRNARRVLSITWRWLYRLRSLVLSIPVAVMALSLAIRNLWVLPAKVGINLLESGEYSFYIGKGLAVLLPLALTAFCLILLYSSKKILYPWLISVFSLALPLLIWVTNVIPS